MADAAGPHDRRLLPNRRFDYDRRLLPHPLLAEFEPDLAERESERAELERLSSFRPADEDERQELVQARTRARAKLFGGAEWSLGYPGWNLVYYALFCSLPPDVSSPIVVETGTNRGLSTIVMAQALVDVGVEGNVETVEVDPPLLAEAEQNVDRAGLLDRVRFHAADAVAFLEQLTSRVPRIDFLFLDDLHDYEHVMRELDIVCGKVAAAPNGTIYFDNIERGGVAQALSELTGRYGGNLVRFPNCSALPPGNAIWQPG